MDLSDFNFNFVEEHKWTFIIIAVLGGLGLWLYWRSGSTSATATDGTAVSYTGTSDATQSAEIAADAQIQQTQYAAQSAQNQINAQVQANQDQITGQIDLATIQAQVANTATAATQDITNNQTSAGLAATLAQVTAASQTAQTQLADQLASQQLQIQGTVDINAQNNAVQSQSISSQQQVLEDQINSALATQESNNGAAVDETSIVNSAAVQNSQIGANLQLGLANAQTTQLSDLLSSLLSPTNNAGAANTNAVSTGRVMTNEAFPSVVQRMAQ